MGLGGPDRAAGSPYCSRCSSARCAMAAPRSSAMATSAMPSTAGPWCATWRPPQHAVLTLPAGAQPYQPAHAQGDADTKPHAERLHINRDPACNAACAPRACRNNPAGPWQASRGCTDGVGWGCRDAGSVKGSAEQGPDTPAATQRFRGPDPAHGAAGRSSFQAVAAPQHAEKGALLGQVWPWEEWGKEKRARGGTLPSGCIAHLGKLQGNASGAGLAPGRVVGRGGGGGRVGTFQADALSTSGCCTGALLGQVWPRGRL